MTFKWDLRSMENFDKLFYECKGIEIPISNRSCTKRAILVQFGSNNCMKIKKKVTILVIIT